MKGKPMRTCKVLALAILSAALGNAGCDSTKDDAKKPAPAAAPAPATRSAVPVTPASRPTAAVAIPPRATQPAVAAAANLIDLPVKLPLPNIKETPKALPPGLVIEKPVTGQRKVMKVPAGAVNLALNKPVTSSDPEPLIGTLDLITDGDKEVAEGNYVELARNPQWVQIDLGAAHPLHAVALWHDHGRPVVYHAVLVQVSDDKDFKTGVTTVYNNDRENLAGQGAGELPGYRETFEGKIIDAGGVKGRYVRLYSAGNTNDDVNRYMEVEVWGLPNR